MQITLRPGEALTVVASTDPAARLDGDAAHAERRAHEQGLLARAGELPPPLRQLVLAADQFVVDRPTAADLRSWPATVG